MILIEFGGDVNLANKNGATPLFIAAQNGHTAVVESFVAAGANVNASRLDGVTPLFMACQVRNTLSTKK